MSDLASVADGLPFVVFGVTQPAAVPETDREVVMGFSQSSGVAQPLVGWNRALVHGDRVVEPITHVGEGAEIVQCTRGEQFVIIVARELEGCAERLFRFVELTELQLGYPPEVQHCSQTAAIPRALGFRENLGEPVARFARSSRAQLGLGAKHSQLCVTCRDRCVLRQELPQARPLSRGGVRDRVCAQQVSR